MRVRKLVLMIIQDWRFLLGTALWNRALSILIILTQMWWYKQWQNLIIFCFLQSRKIKYAEIDH